MRQKQSIEMTLKGRSIAVTNAFQILGQISDFEGLVHEISWARPPACLQSLPRGINGSTCISEVDYNVQQGMYIQRMEYLYVLTISGSDVSGIAHLSGYNTA